MNSFLNCTLNLCRAWSLPLPGSHQSVTKVRVFVSGLTNEEVQLAIQRSGSTEEVLPLTPVGLPQPVHAAQLVPLPHSESQLHTPCAVGVHPLIVIN